MTSTRCVVSFILIILHLDSVSQGDTHKANTRRKVLVTTECFLFATLEWGEVLVTRKRLCISPEPSSGLGRIEGWGFWADTGSHPPGRFTAARP